MYDIRHTFFLFWHIDVDNTFSIFCAAAAAADAVVVVDVDAVVVVVDDVVAVTITNGKDDDGVHLFFFFLHQTTDVGRMNLGVIMKLTPFSLPHSESNFVGLMMVMMMMKCVLKMLIVNTFQFKLPIQDVYLTCVSIEVE